LEIVKKFVFNRNKKDTIILIHGLYTSSGFWLSFFKLFKNFRIIAFDINYEKLLRSEYNKEFLKASFVVDGQIVGVISHSFGTVISDLVFDYENDKIHKICPVAFSKRIEPNNFILDILNKTPLSEESINQNIKLVNTFVSKMRDSLNCNGQIYIPIDDCYFSYDVPQKNKIHFAGDHFNIGIALNEIINIL
jgi:hypothetical protein